MTPREPLSATLPLNAPDRLRDAQRRVRPLLVALPALGLLAGLSASALGSDKAAQAIFAGATLPVLVMLFVEIVSSLRRGDVGLDIVAALSMTGALVFSENLAAIVVALMYAGGQYLEDFAERHARREMTALLARVPRTALRHRNGGLEEIALADVAPGDRLLIRRGDVVPADGTLANGSALLDQSALTGEALPVRQRAGEAVMSGATNVGDAFDLTATHRASESTYAGIVRLVENAQRSKAPMARLADRYAMGFLALTVTIAGGAWMITGDPIRALAVLVVATPCPLILAVPVAIVSGMSRAAKAGILVKNGKALEVMAQVRSLVLDKTGTLTHGEARLVRTHGLGDCDDNTLLRLAASLDQASEHVIARALVGEAQARGLPLFIPSEVHEVPGEGVSGIVDGRQVLIGGEGFVASRIPGAKAMLADARPRAGSVTVAVAVDGRLAGTLVLADMLREGTRPLLDGLRAAGLSRLVLATGDRRDVAQAVAAALPFDAIHAELTPDRKIAVVAEERRRGPVMMVGDGVNDAPALAAADIGVAMGARGAAASAEAADVVLLVDRIDRIPLAIAIARRARAIALQSVYAGIGLSLLGMIAAAFGFLTPVQGALVQEAIDVTAILNALRALQGDERQ